MRNIYHRMLALFKRKRQLSPAEIEKLLSPEALEKVRNEAEFLRTSHGVEVCALAAGEKPGKPRPTAPEIP